MERVLSILRLPLFIVGVVLFFVTERYLSAEKYATALLITSFALILCSLSIIAIFFFKQWRLKNKATTRIWWLIGAWEKSVLFGLVLYLIYDKLSASLNIYDSVAMKVLLGAWLLCIVLGFFAGIGVELSQRSSGTGKLAEVGRVKRAAAEWLSIGMFLSFLICVNYASNVKDKSYDFSYLKSTSVGESTLKMVESLNKSLAISIFYPKNNDVRPHVEEYFNNLKYKSDKVEVNFFDVDLNPQKAEELRIAKNGQVVLSYDGRNENLNVGLQLSSARGTLKTLDSKFQETFLKLTQSSNTVYFTTGHGEMSLQPVDDSNSPLRTIAGLNTFLTRQNFVVKTLGVEDGSMNKVPDDAGVVVIAGHIYPFAEAEVKAIEAYLNNGGSLFLLLDISKPSENLAALDLIKHEDPLLKYLEKIGVKYNKQVLANDRNYVQIQSGAVDRWFLFSNSFTTHESVINLSRNDERVAVLFFKSGYFDLNTTPQSQWRFAETLRSVPDTFVDLNRNFNFDDKTEKRNSYTVGLAGVLGVSPINNSATEATDDTPKYEKEAKILAYASSSITADAVLSNVANIVLASDSIKWLTGQSKFSGPISSEEDVKIQHTRKENALWFNVTVAGVPLVILLLGFALNRLRRKNK